MCEDKDYLEKEFNQVQSVIDATESDFEQKLLYISSGALLLSLTLLEKVLKFESCEYVVFLILGWSLLALTLIVNLASQQLSAHFLRLQQSDINSELSFDDRKAKVEIRNRITFRVNMLTIIFLVLGLVFIIIFSGHNAVIQSKTKPNITMCSKSNNNQGSSSNATNSSQVESRGRSNVVPFNPSSSNGSSNGSSSQSQSGPSNSSGSSSNTSNK